MFPNKSALPDIKTPPRQNFIYLFFYEGAFELNVWNTKTFSFNICVFNIFVFLQSGGAIIYNLLHRSRIILLLYLLFTKFIYFVVKVPRIPLIVLPPHQQEREYLSYKKRVRNKQVWTQ